MFTYLLNDHGLIALGLYRLQGATDNSDSYVSTNPNPKTLITNRDRVFVLGKEISKDFQIDLNKNSKKQKDSTQKYMVPQKDTQGKDLNKREVKMEIKQFYGVGQ